MKAGVAGLSGMLALVLLLPMEAGVPIPVPADLLMFAVGERVAAGKFPLWLAVVAAGIGLGVLWGAIFGFAAHLATRGERDFSSLRGLSAARYDLIAREGGAEQARTALERAGLLPAEAPLT